MADNPMLTTIHELRRLITNNELFIFMGEHTSALTKPGEQPPCLDDWWDFIDFNDAKKTRRVLGELETQCLGLQPQKQSRIHNILRTVGNFPLILTTNLDLLIERFYWKSGADGDKIRIDQIGTLPIDLNQLDNNVIIKCYGDTSLLTQATNDTKEFFNHLCEGEIPDGNSTAQRFHSLFDTHSILFLGCDFNHPIYQKLNTNFVATSKRKHYIFQSKSTHSEMEIQNLVRICADLQIWEFVQYLSSGGSSALQDISAASGQVIELSFLPTQREEYLNLQLHLEKDAMEIAFHTATITNALATDELLECNSRPSLEKIYRNDPFGIFSFEKVEAAFKAMKDRRDNLLKIIETNRDVKVIVAFLYETAEAEVDPKKQKKEKIRRMALSKYAKVLLRAKSVLSTKSSLELRIVGGTNMTDEDKRRFNQQFGIFKLNDGVDEASCFAQQALHDKSPSHLVIFNGAEVTRHRRILETTIGRAWDPETSLLRLAALILKHNGHEDGKHGAIDDEELTAIKDMYDVQVITSRPDYDPRTLQFLGRGAFGEVYKVTEKSGKTFAIKMLKELETPDVSALEKFKRETESLSKISHPNIVKLEEVMREGHRLCFKLEFVDGGDLRNLIEPKDGQPNPQSKEFVLKAAKQIGAALAYLHQNDLIHGDVKAENVMVTKDRSTLKLTDFGLARNAPKDVTQTRTREGSMRYMAPEVATETRLGKARYSNKADVYSYGLLLIEVISGRYIFEEYVDPKVVLSKKVEGSIDPRIPADCESEHGPIIKQVLTGCLKYQYRSRLTMLEVTQMLEGKEDALKRTKGVQLLCLGTGKGVTAAMYGESSSSMVIVNDGKPVLLVDMGLGVIKAYRSILGEIFPKDIFITHNHSDHSGELALGGFLVVDKIRKEKLPFKLNVLCGPEVKPKLRDHRLDECYSAVPKEYIDNFLEWTMCAEGEKVYLNKEKTLYLITHRSQHTETTYGFNLYHQDKNILGFSADSGFNQEVYNKIYAASTVVVDAREESTKEHASFDEVIEFGEKLQVKPHRVYVTGYGRQDEWPDDKTMPSIMPLVPGELYTL